jgi:DNA-binding CsgD family transcriptional regulator
MTPRRTRKSSPAASGAKSAGDFLSAEPYARLYPTFAGRVRVILESDKPFVRERMAVLKALVTRQSGEGLDWFARRYKLTPAEARIAIFLAEGGTVADCAAQSRVAQATVRSHLKSIFRKTGAVRQADLSALLLRRGMML